MKKLLLIFLLLPVLSLAQAGQWTWMKGANVANQWGNYGALGVAAASNVPGARYESGGMRDNQNNFWLFGGSGYDHKGSLGILDDFWKYDPSTNNWTWISGDSSTLQLGVYGTKGVPSPTNKPGQRFAFVTWNELNGALWMWGGNGLNDLWKYDLATGEWTWMTGSSISGAIGVYGTKGMPAAANTPGARGEITCSWSDSSGNLWLFGGFGYAATNTSGYLNDLWMYSPGSNQWTWVSGDNVVNQAGIYGTLGTPSPANKPGARQVYNSWIGSQNNLWLFGGVNSLDYYNDLWMYSIATSQWTWMGGSSLGMNGNNGGHYGTKNVGDSLNIPSRRFENKADWVDGCGNFWTYGGGNTIGDLWSYNPSNHQWTWVSGDTVNSTAPVYGTQGVPDPLNKPGAREGSPSWKHSDGSLWVFGGNFSSAPRGNDLWRYVISSANAVIKFQASDSNICANDCINFTDLSTNASSWQWSFTGGSPSSSADQNPQNVCYLTGGNYDVKLVAYFAGGVCGSGYDSLTYSNYISVNPAPATPNIIQSNDTLFCTTNPTYTGYQWFFESGMIPGATDTFLVISQSGNYNIEVTNQYGCGIAVGINIVGIKEVFDKNNISLFPDPATSRLTLSFSSVLPDEPVKISITNVLGQIVQNPFSGTLQANTRDVVINIENLPAGIYFVQLYTEKERWTGRFVKSSSGAN